MLLFAVEVLSFVSAISQSVLSVSVQLPELPFLPSLFQVVPF